MRCSPKPLQYRGLVMAEAAIRIGRSGGPWWFRVQSFKVELDVVLVDGLKGGEERTLRVQPGQHKVCVSDFGWWCGPSPFGWTSGLGT